MDIEENWDKVKTITIPTATAITGTFWGHACQQLQQQPQQHSSWVGSTNAQSSLEKRVVVAELLAAATPPPAAALPVSSQYMRQLISHGS
jgi:hypothetical protein